jgi:hypothetical protein
MTKVTQEKLHSVYALVDPRKSEVRYIGASCNIDRRYSQHISDRDKSNQGKQSWIDELKIQGLRPKLIILESGLEKARSLIRERYWIQIHLKKDAILTNMRDAELLPWECRQGVK